MESTDPQMSYKEGGGRPPRIVPTYAATAGIYDRLVGEFAFEQWKENFERLEKRYRLDLTRVADVACGTGLATRYFMARGIEVYAFDRSPEMLRVAADATRGMDLRLLRQDMRRLLPPAKVTMLTCATDALNHLLREEDIRSTLSSFHSSLLPGGCALFDMNTVWQLRKGEDPEPWHFELDRLRMTWRSSWNEEESIATVMVILRDQDAGHGDLAEIHRERAYTPEWITAELLQAGFGGVEVFDAAGLGIVGERTRRLQFAAFRRDNSPWRSGENRGGNHGSYERRRGTR